MATLTPQVAALTGLDVSFSSAASGGDQFANSGKEYFHVVNGSGSSITVTADAQTNCNFGFDHDAAVAVPAGEERVIGPFPTNRFNDANGNVQVTYSDVTSLTVAVVTVS